jgi:hypothetical protein
MYNVMWHYWQFQSHGIYIYIYIYIYNIKADVVVIYLPCDMYGNIFCLTRGINVKRVLVLLVTYLCHLNNKYTLLIIHK